MMENYSLFFIRHGKLLLPYKDHSEIPFDVLADLALEKLNPPIDKNLIPSLIKQISSVIPFKKIEKIYTSPLKRCQETAVLIANFINQNLQKKLPIMIVPELKEVYFDLKKIYPLLVRDRSDIEEINNRVFRAMINGKDCESVLNIYKRVGCVFEKIHKPEISLSITHDFFMRVIEIYIKKQGQSNPSITYEDLKNTKRNLYLHGFATNSSLSTFFSF